MFAFYVVNRLVDIDLGHDLLAKAQTAGIVGGVSAHEETLAV